MINENKTKTIGLTDNEAKERLKKYGYNTLKNEKKVSMLKIFFSQFNDFIIWVLIGATLISLFMGERADAITILIIIIMNSILGFYQEYSTEKSLESLKKMASPTAKVCRTGNIIVINANEIVPGDLIYLESGDRIPADGIVINHSNFRIDEALLTGESIGVLKSLNKNSNEVYMGTNVLTGRGEVLVDKTGMKTEMGKIADMLSNIEEDISPLNRKLESLGKVLVVICIVICFVVTLLGIARGNDPYQMFLLGVSLAVAAIPEGLPAIVTVSLALGVSRMLKRKALVRKLPAVETLGCTSVICSDKTGTLTQNIMSVKSIFYNNKLHNISNDGVCKFQKLKEVFSFCNSCSFDLNNVNIKNGILGDPTEIGLIKVFYKSLKEVKDFISMGNKISENPFDSDRKMMSVIFRINNKKISYVKGAPEKIINNCKYIYLNEEVVPITIFNREIINKAVEAMAKNALRCIAAAYKIDNNLNEKTAERDLIFIGVAGMIDPPRANVRDSINRCKKAGIRTVMITGDHKNTAFAIASELDICSSIDEVVTGEQLDKISEKDIDKLVEKTTVFARVNAGHKLQIVKAFKRKNKVVAMTGDGVNDAPAVKEADIGVSMGLCGTDVTKEASSMILLDDNFSTIVAAIEEGRVIYSNIRKFIRYLLSCNLGEVLTVLLASLLNVSTPLLPIQILFVNLATDGLPAIALGMDSSEEDNMNNLPIKKNESIFSNGLWEKIIIRGSLIGVCTILAFLVGSFYGFSIETSRTIALGTLIISQLLHVFECRSEKKSLFEINIFENKTLLVTVFISMVMVVSIIYIPFFSKIFHTTRIDFYQWCIIIFFSGIISVISSLYNFIKK